MEGGMTRKRGYLWLTLLLLAATLTLLAVQPKGNHPLPDSSINDSSLRLLSDTSHPKPSGGLPNSQSPYSPRKKKPLVFELNTADSLDLVQLYNIGPTIARRILKYRSLLGGYIRKEQLREVYGIDTTRYNDIAPHLTVNPSAIQKIDLNTADIDQLKHHPYLDYYQAKAILRYREQNGPYKQVSDILNIPLIDSETFTLIEPYLTCNSQQNK